MKIGFRMTRSRPARTVNPSPSLGVLAGTRDIREHLVETASESETPGASDRFFPNLSRHLSSHLSRQFFMMIKLFYIGKNMAR
jgi:hypothetical protein